MVHVYRNIGSDYIVADFVVPRKLSLHRPLVGGQAESVCHISGTLLPPPTPASRLFAGYVLSCQAGVVVYPPFVVACLAPSSPEVSLWA